MNNDYWNAGERKYDAKYGGSCCDCDDADGISTEIGRHEEQNLGEEKTIDPENGTQE